MAKRKSRKKSRRQSPSRRRRAPARKPARRRARAKSFVQRPEVQYAAAAIAGVAIASMLSEVPQVQELGAKVPGGPALVGGAAIFALSFALKGRGKRFAQAAAVGALASSAIGVAREQAASYNIPLIPNAPQARIAAPSTAVQDYLTKDRATTADLIQ